MVVLNFAPVFLIASANCCFPSGLSTTMSLNSGTLIFGPQCATHKPKTFNTMNANDCFGVRDSKAKDQHLPRLRHLKFLDQSNMIDLCLSFSLNLFSQFILMVCISSFGDTFQSISPYLPYIRIRSYIGRDTTACEQASHVCSDL